jgi:hypothetical protein
MRYALRAAIVAVAVGAALAATAGAEPPAPDCPQRALPLPPDAVAPAARAALEAQRGRYEELGTRPIVTRAALATFDEARGRGARRDCGRRVARRTVVVHLESASAEFRRRRPSLSQGVVFVSRVPGSGYRVWRVVH